MRQRLQKILAQAGYGSRRAAESLITSGRVRINGAVSVRLGTQADPDVDVIEVDDAQIRLDTAHVCIAMFKPSGYVTTARDTHGRETVMSLLPPDTPAHVLPVGRLDLDTEGLLIFTNDGELAHRLAHPRYELDKEYYALVAGTPESAAIDRLARGVVLDGERTAPAEVRPAGPPHGYDERRGHTWMRIIIHEGRKRQVRRMFDAVGHHVRALVRTRVGNVELGRMTRGETRPLSHQEVRLLRDSVGLDD